MALVYWVRIGFANPTYKSYLQSEQLEESIKE